jgi:hypothetical protein
VERIDARSGRSKPRRPSNHNSDPTFPRRSPVQRNQARMGRLNYRRIGSDGSLFLRHALLSYLHVMPHGRVYKAQRAPLQINHSQLSHPPQLSTFPALESSLVIHHTKTFSPGRRVLRISKRPEPVHHCPLFLVHLARTIELQSVKPSCT